MVKFDELFDELPVDFKDVDTTSWSQKQKIVGDYLVGRTVGEGSFAKVKLGLHLLSQEKVALKVTRKPVNNHSLEKVRKRMCREISTMKKLDHPNIARLLEVLETEHHFYIVIEYIDNGDFMAYIKQKKRLGENEARGYVQQIASALHHMHQTGVVHRDLKVENLMLDSDMNIKIIDFGLSNTCEYGESLLSTQCGSPAYAAPEIYDRKHYGAEVDVWSLGVNLYAMLCGTLPFVADSPPKLTQLRAQISRGCHIPGHLSESCRDLIEQLLEPDGMKRVKMAEVLAHKWVTEGAASQIRIPELSSSKMVPEHLDKPVVQYMLRSFNVSEAQIKEAVCCRRSNSISATYHLICRRRHKGLGFPEPPMSKYLEKWGLRKEDGSKSKERLRSEISIGSSQLLHYHRQRRGASAAMNSSNQSPDTHTDKMGRAAINHEETTSGDGSRGNLPRIQVLIKLKDRPTQSSHDINQHSLYAKCLEGSASSETFKTSSVGSDDKVSSDMSATKHPAAYLDYKEYLRQLRACKLRSSKSILKQDTPVDMSMNAIHYQKLSTPITISIPQVTDSPETLSPQHSTANTNSLDADTGERRERSAKSVRFCVDDEHSEDGYPHSMRVESRRASSPKKPLEKFVVRRLSAHTKSRRDFSLVARIQNEKSSQSSDSEKEDRTAAVCATRDDLHRLKAMNMMWRNHQGPVMNPPPPPPNSADGSRIEQSPSPKGRLSPPKNDSMQKHNDRKAPAASPDIKDQSRPADGSHRSKSVTGNPQTEQVNGAWERNVLNLSGEKNGMARAVRGLPDLPMRKLGTLRSQTLSPAKYAESKQLSHFYTQPEPEPSLSPSTGLENNSFSILHERPTPTKLKRNTQSRHNSDDSRTPFRHKTEESQGHRSEEGHSNKSDVSHGHKSDDRRTSSRLQLRVRLPSANITDSPLCGTVVLDPGSA